MDPRFQNTTQAEISIEGDAVVVCFEGLEYRLRPGGFSVAVEPWTPGVVIRRERLDASPIRDIRINRRVDGGPGYVGKLDERDPLIDELIAMSDRTIGIKGPIEPAIIADTRRKAFDLAGDDPTSLGLIAAADNYLTDRYSDEYKLGVLPRSGRPSREVVDRLRRLSASGHPGLVRLNELVGYAVDRAGGLSQVERRPSVKKDVSNSEMATWKLVGSALFGVAMFAGIAFFALPVMLRSVEEQKADMLAAGEQFDAGIGGDRIAIIFLGFFAVVALLIGIVNIWEALGRFEPIKPAMDAVASALGAVGKVVVIALLALVALATAGWMLSGTGCDGELVPVDRFGSYECLERP